MNDPLPTLVQVLNGEKPANTDPIRVDTVPGTQWRYSGGGVTIEQLLMMDVTGKAFPALMRELVVSEKSIVLPWQSQSGVVSENSIVLVKTLDTFDSFEISDLEPRKGHENQRKMV